MTSPLSILLVDDEELVRDAIVMVLERQRMNVQACSGAKEALALDKLSEFDLVITDLVMPDMDGVLMIKELRAREITCPIIAITGGARVGQKNMAERAVEAGALMALRKPVNRQQILDSINEAVGNKG